MYFYLDDSLIVDENDTEFAKIKKARKYLSLGYSAGNHLLGGDNGILEFYKNAFYESDKDTYSVLAELCDKSYEGIPIGITFYVEVVKNISIPLRIENDIEIKQIKYDFFRNSKKIQKTNFIVEDLDDADFYNYICQCKLGGKEYVFEKINGGGTNTIDSVRQHAFTQKEITISIIDTDKNFASDNDSSKLSEFKKQCDKIKQKDNIIMDYLVINVHEIENLIPLDIIDQLEYQQGGQQENKNDFDLIKGSNIANDILPFFDTKKGIVKLKSIYDNPDFIQYIKPIVRLKPTLLTTYNNDFDAYYAKIEVVEGKKGNDSKGKIWSGLRHDLLKETLKYISKNIDSLLTPKILPFQEKEWTRISNFIYTMCCCYKNNEARN